MGPLGTETRHEPCGGGPGRVLAENGFSLIHLRRSSQQILHWCPEKWAVWYSQSKSGSTGTPSNPLKLRPCSQPFTHNFLDLVGLADCHKGYG